MSVDAQTLNQRVEEELAALKDERVLNHVRELLVEPHMTLRAWDYADEATSYPCWTVLEHTASNTGIAYSELGFGPISPWGLVWLRGDEGRMSIGMDSSWFRRFLDAVFETSVVSDLRIWRVAKEMVAGERSLISPEGGWDATWKLIENLRAENPTAHYYCDHCIDY